MLIAGSSAGAALLVGGIAVAATVGLAGDATDPNLSHPIATATSPRPASPTTRSAPATSPLPPSSASASSPAGPPGLPVEAKAGQCVGQDRVTRVLAVQPCGASGAYFTVVATPSTPTCAAGYASAQGSSTYLCLTLDVQAGDCAEATMVKADCAAPQATIKVVAVQPGPKTGTSCVGVPGATRAMLTGPEPANVACFGSKS